MLSGTGQIEQVVDLIPHFRGRHNLIIGQAPQRSAPDVPEWRPWDSDSGRRLAVKLGMTHEMMMAVSDTTNLNEKLTGTHGKWDDFDANEASGRAKALVDILADAEYRVVLCCGVRVWRFMCEAAEVPTTRDPDVRLDTIYATYFAGVPHPGGTNRWWNDEDNAMRGNLFLHRIGNAMMTP